MKMAAHTPDQLKRASRHVYYEVQMLVDTANALQVRTIDKLTENALLESFGVHARALLDFLERTQSTQDDVYAALYFQPPAVWTQPTFSAVLNPVREDVNKQFAHITFTRLNYDPPHEKQWAVGPIASAICALIEAHFCSKVDPALLDERWKGGCPTPMRDGTGKTVATGIRAELASSTDARFSTTAVLTVTTSKDEPPKA